MGRVSRTRDALTQVSNTGQERARMRRPHNLGWLKATQVHISMMMMMIIGQAVSRARAAAGGQRTEDSRVGPSVTYTHTICMYGMGD